MKVKVFYGDEVPKLHYQTSGSSGLDLRSTECIRIHSNQIEIVKTGIYLIIPEGYQGQICSRSGLASKGLVVANAPGIIDNDYRGELKVILHNTTHNDFIIGINDRIAQLIFVPIIKPELIVFDDYVEWAEESITCRGHNGIGSTGLK